MRGELLGIRNYFDCLSDILNKAADRAASAAALILVKFTWHGHMPYSSVEWGLAFPVRAICLHRERDSAPQAPVEGLPVPGEFHERWY